MRLQCYPFGDITLCQPSAQTSGMLAMLLPVLPTIIMTSNPAQGQEPYDLFMHQ